LTGESQYFRLDPDLLSDESGEFIAVDADLPLKEFGPGLCFRPVLGRNMLVAFVTLEPHSEAPLHAHSEEQITIVIEGELEFELAGRTRVLGPMEVALIPPNVPHRARTREKACSEIDVFYPPRQALVDALSTSGPSAT
jgi:quercetin dioxygenase-like cupin family protein